MFELFVLFFVYFATNLRILEIMNFSISEFKCFCNVIRLNLIQKEVSQNLINKYDDL